MLMFKDSALRNSWMTPTATFTVVSVPEAYLELRQTSVVELFTKAVNS